ncbi:MAG: hypothetical protein GF364_22395, partial [Candidatus Lokiarchaeota archaeon]|nr:hypothetical protein [Candidatus Lokiarchaeota archaeon]
MTEALSVNTSQIINKIAAKIQARPSYIKNVLDLLEEGSTVHFIARYRKEKTGAMNEDEIRTIKDDFKSLNEIEEKRINILQTIRVQDTFQELEMKEQKKYEQKILKAKNLTELEDLFRPYKPKRETRATKALKKGLGKLAKIIKEERQGTEEDREEIIAKFITPKPEEKEGKKIRTVKELTGIIRKIKKAIKE